MTHLDKKILGASLLALVGLASTSGAQEAPGTTPPMQETPAPAEPATECPEFVRGAKLTVSDIAGGVQFKILAGQPGFVDPLRQMTREIADFIEQHEQQSMGMQSQAETFPPMNIEVKNVQGGAIVTVRAEKGTSVKELRTQAKNLEELWRSSRCINGSQDSAALLNL